MLRAHIVTRLRRWFENARKHGELHENGLNQGELPSPTHPVMSLKEELADQEEEKDLVTMEDEEHLDIVGDLSLPVEYTQGKDRASTDSLDELNLPSSEEQSPGLNFDASKQKVQLRQRGSLANRRKPTRTSVRSASTGDDSVFSDNRDAPLMNGHDVSMEISPFSVPGTTSQDDDNMDNMTNIDMSIASQGHVIRPGKIIHGIKTAVVQSDVIESGRLKLRSVPTPGSMDRSAPPVTGEEQEPPTPPWLIEARLRRSSRASQGETEKLKQEMEPEKPPWMKEALTKKKRAANRTSQTSIEETPSTSEADSPNVVPWMQETARRRSVRTTPLNITQKDVTNNVNNMIADSSSSTKTDLIEDISDKDTDIGQEVISSINNEPTNSMNGHLPEQENLPLINRESSTEPSPAKKMSTELL